MLSVSVQFTDPYVVVRPEGELDAFSVSKFREAANGVPEGADGLIDLNSVSFMDSTGLGALIALIRRLQETGGRAVISCRVEAVRRVIITAGLDRLVDVVNTAQDGAAILADSS